MITLSNVNRFSQVFAPPHHKLISASYAVGHRNRFNTLHCMLKMCYMLTRKTKCARHQK